MLERHEIEAFLTLAEELHFGRTAERMHVSTARVSQTIRRLERRVGAQLFRRTSRRVELTPVGQQLYQDIRPAWEQIDSAVERAIAAGRGITGTLRVGFVDAAGSQLLAGAAELFGRRHPDCQVVIRELPPAVAPDRLRAGEVDVLLAALPNRARDLATGPVLVSEARMLAVSATHAFARRETLTVADLDRVAMARLPDSAGGDWRDDGDSSPRPDAAPAASGAQPATVHEALTLVGSGQVGCLLGAHARRYHPRPDVAYVPIDGLPPLRWGLYWRADGATARVRGFADVADDLVRGAR